ncbi:MAG: hypothetical protein AAFY72_15885 [Cyanobacteria bacterium J06649_4]
MAKGRALITEQSPFFQPFDAGSFAVCEEMPDRFAGALLGLLLTPVAMSEDFFLKCSSLKRSSVQVPDVVSTCFHHMRRYLQETSQFSVQVDLPADVLNSLPVLLRYCDDGLSRWKKLSEFSVSAIAPCLVLGDALMLFHATDPRSLPFARLQLCQSQMLDAEMFWQSAVSQALAQSARYDLSAVQARQYVGLWCAIAAQFFTMQASYRPSFVEPSNHFDTSTYPQLTADERAAHQPFIGGVACAFFHAGSYGLAGDKIAALGRSPTIK